MANFFREERGNVLAIVAGAIFAVFGMGALAIDVGYILTARNQLQAAVDASALAGGSGLVVSETEAVTQAIHFAARNNCINQPVVIAAGDVTFPAPARVRVQATRPLDLYFGKVLGISTMNIAVAAVAEVGSLTGVEHLKPWAIPEYPYTVGEPVVLKTGELGAPATNPSYFYPVDFPPLNKGTPITGADEYSQNIINGSADLVEIGDVLQVEPGNQVGPTAQGVEELIALDPYASWGETQNKVVNSSYPGDTSPRIIMIPFYDPNDPPSSGRNTITVTNLGAFFLEGVKGRNVYGRFIEIVTVGSGWGNIPTPLSLKRVKLVQ
jgi:hypothetical protein